MSEDNLDIDHSNDEDEFTKGSGEDDTPTLEDFLAKDALVKELEGKVSELDNRNKKLYARLKGGSREDLTNSQNSNGLEEKLNKLELKTEGFTEQEVEFLSQYGGKKALENPIVKTALEVMREKAKAEQAVVESSESGSSIEKKYTDKQLRAMSSEELEALIRSS